MTGMYLNHVLGTDLQGNMVRVYSPATGVVVTLAGSGFAGSANGPVAFARFSMPTGVAATAAGDIYIADT